MTDLHARKRQFKGIDTAEADKLCRGAVGIVARYCSMIIAVSCNVADAERLAPRQASADAVRLLDGFVSPYNCCMHWAMFSMGEMLRTSGQRVEYWFEQGDGFQGAARRFVATLANPHGESLKRSYGQASVRFVSANDARLFGAADLVAWEWARHVDRVKTKQPTRRSLAALMGSECVIDDQPGHNTVGRYANHLEGTKLERFFGKLTMMFKATTAEEVSAAAASTAWDTDSPSPPSIAADGG